MLKRLSIIILTALLLLSGLAQPAQAKKSVHVKGTIVAYAYFTNCTSPIGICLSGTITGNELKGTVSGQALTTKDVTIRGKLYALITGFFDISTSKGKLHGNTVFLDTVELTGKGTLAITKGTRRYDGAQGLIGLNQPTPPDLTGKQVFYYDGFLFTNSD